ncbi:hypothetical protein VPH35_075456 [Triticum aestivum]
MDKGVRGARTPVSLRLPPLAIFRPEPNQTAGRRTPTNQITPHASFPPLPTPPPPRRRHSPPPPQRPSLPPRRPPPRRPPRPPQVICWPLEYSVEEYLKRSYL